MNEIYIQDLVRADFHDYPQFKMRGKTMEVITPFTMANRDMVSVFVRENEEGFDCAAQLVMGKLSRSKKRQRNELAEEFGLGRKGDWYYMKVRSPEVIGSAIANIAEFAVAASWLFGVVPGDEV